PSVFALCGAVESLVAPIRGRCTEKNLSLDVNVPASIRVRLERGRFDRVLGNLLDNAVKFTDQGGIIVEAQTNGRGLEIHVLDSGVGIAPEHHEKLFSEFFQVGNKERSRQKGFGLGLAIARHLARQMGGEIAVESALGSGSRFTLV